SRYGNLGAPLVTMTPRPRHLPQLHQLTRLTQLTQLPRQPHPDSLLLDSLAHRIDIELPRALRGARTVALVNFPNHNHPGDSALWLGARASLKRLGVHVAYQCAWSSYSPEALARAYPERPVLINGGGNFGDLYRGQQRLRERLLADQRGRHIIQLPQSIH